jgi:hypothetical protein
MEYEKELSTLKGMLGEGKFQTQWDNGGRLSMDAAIELALKE